MAMPDNSISSPTVPRRIVTGSDANGRSVVISDGPAPCRVEPAPGMACTMMWRSDESPARNTGHADAAAGAFDPTTRRGGSVFFIVEYPPMGKESSSDGVPAPGSVASALPDGYQRNPGRYPGSHRTPTLDYVVVLKDEMTLVLDEGAITLGPGDSVIDRGVYHAWENRGDVPALMASIMIDAQPVDR